MTPERQPGSEPEFQLRGFGKRAAGPNRRIHVAAVLALTEPGPAAAGVVVMDERGRVVASRASYIGRSRRDEAAAQALLLAMRLAHASALESPTFLVDDAGLAGAMGGGAWPDALEQHRPALEQAAEQLGAHAIEVIPTSANQARSVALTPLVEWLPERTRRAEELQVRPLGNGLFEVQSESTPDQTYRVTFRVPGDPGATEGEMISCECADFLYRGIPCKHLLAVARDQGATERLFVGQRSA
jgi:hypothetical protein